MPKPSVKYTMCWWRSEEDGPALSIDCYFEDDQPGTSHSLAKAYADPHLLTPIRDLAVWAPGEFTMCTVAPKGEADAQITLEFSPCELL
jgi:hypothetical protein